MKRELAYFLVRLVPGQMLMAVIFSVLAGVSTVALFAFIFAAVRANASSNLRDQLIFVTLAVAFIASRSFSALAMAGIARAVMVKLRDNLIAEILQTPYRQLEKIGTVRLLAAVTSDVQTIAAAAPTLVNAATSFAIVGSLLVYIAWLSPPGAAVVVASAALGVPIYLGLVGKAARFSYDSGRLWERLHANLDGLISGIKQLRLNTARTSQYLSDDIAATQDRFLDLRVRAAHTTALATNTGQVVFLIVLGILLFLHRSSYLASSTVEVFFAAIYLMGPLDGGLAAIASLVHIDVVFRRNRELGMALASVSRAESGTPDAGPQAAAWQYVRFEAVTYCYDEAASFEFGPVDLLLERGQIIFVKGGNGSGKSTFAKLLAGLYLPKAGSISIDQSRIDEINRQSYRERFCCIFDDAHVFESICTKGRSDPAGDTARSLIRDWSLERSVDVCQSRFTNTRELSRGQRKKLLLISAMIEDREIYVFDEWAADQDAASRKKFYFELLPTLKRDGKLVVVLTHDEEFDAAADHIIKFHGGAIVQSSRQMLSPRDYALAPSS